MWTFLKFGEQSTLYIHILLCSVLTIVIWVFEMVNTNLKNWKKLGIWGIVVCFLLWWSNQCNFLFHFSCWAVSITITILLSFSCFCFESRMRVCMTVLKVLWLWVMGRCSVTAKMYAQSFKTRFTKFYESSSCGPRWYVILGLLLTSPCVTELKSGNTSWMTKVW